MEERRVTIVTDLYNHVAVAGLSDSRIIRRYIDQLDLICDLSEQSDQLVTITRTMMGADTLAQEILDGFSTGTLNTDFDIGDQEICTVCQDEYGETELRTLPCLHTFHTDCIDHYLLDVSARCPICRFDTREANFHIQ